MLRRLRLRRSVWLAVAVGILATPLLLGGATATPADAGDQLPPPEPDPRETPPPDGASAEALLELAQANTIADLAPEEYRSLVVAAASRHKVDPRLLAAVISVETEWDPTAVGMYGELGLMQILPETGAYLANEAGLTEYDLADPATNLALGALYLGKLVTEYGDVQTALAVYNGGPGALAYASTSVYAHKVLKKYLVAPRDRHTMYESAS
ncbi:MAG TPA: lytic transglycosylase domain-containing protein [Symbiobacteriaceae bacterium]|nr:lytic transglycosylase domain-containing protein [Symbiobacteriaceae bacterium]